MGDARQSRTIRRVPTGRRPWVACLILGAALLSACATSVPPVVYRGPAGPASLDCAETALREAEYDVRGEGGGLVAELRVSSGPVATRRELITVTVDPLGTLEALVEAYRIEPATHSIPAVRQTSVLDSPLDSTGRTAQAVVQGCSRQERGRPWRSFTAPRHQERE